MWAAARCALVIILSYFTATGDRSPLESNLALVGEITARSTVEEPFRWVNTSSVSQKKAESCFVLCGAALIRKASVDDQSDSFANCSVYRHLFILVGRIWNPIPDTCLREYRESVVNSGYRKIFADVVWPDGWCLFRFGQIWNSIYMKVPSCSKSRFPANVNYLWLNMEGGPRDKGAMRQYRNTQPCSIGSSRSILGIDCSLVEKTQAAQRYEIAEKRYPIKPTGYPDLPFPEVPLIGAMTAIVGMHFSNKALENGPVWLVVVGWAVAVCGGLPVLLWVLPYWAAVVGMLFGFN